MLSFKSGVKGQGVIDGEIEGGDCDEVTCTGQVNQEESEQNEVNGMKKRADSTGYRRCISERAVGDL